MSGHYRGNERGCKPRGRYGPSGARIGAGEGRRPGEVLTKLLRQGLVEEVPVASPEHRTGLNPVAHLR